MLFRSGITPITEFKVTAADGSRQRATLSRRRCDLSGISHRAYEAVWVAWELMVLAAFGESIDPGHTVNGVYLHEKTNRTNLVRFEIWFGTDDGELCDAVAAGFADMIQSFHGLRSITFNFVAV